MSPTFQPGSSSKAWCRPLFNPFQAPGARISSFRLLILVSVYTVGNFSEITKSSRVETKMNFFGHFDEKTWDPISHISVSLKGLSHEIFFGPVFWAV
jgi:hypothetical protein